MSTREIKSPTEGSAMTFVRFKDAAPGTTLATGIYRGSMITQHDKPLYKIEQADGSLVGLNSTKNLANKMAQVKEGERVTVTLKSKEPMQNGPYKGKEAYLFTVAVDDAAAPAAASSTSSN